MKADRIGRNVLDDRFQCGGFQDEQPTQDIVPLVQHAFADHLDKVAISISSRGSRERNHLFFRRHDTECLELLPKFPIIGLFLFRKLFE